MDYHPIQGEVVIPLVASCWVPCDGLASHPGGVVILLVASYWVLCDGLSSHPGGVVILLVASYWVPCDGLSSHPGGVVILLVASCWVPCDGLSSHPGGSSNTPSCFMLGTLWWTSIPSRGSSNTPSCFILGSLWWTIIPSRGSSNTPSCFILGSLWWTIIPSRGSSNTPSCFILGSLWWTIIPSRGSSNTPTLHTVDAPAVRTAAKTVLSWRHRISLWTKWRNFVVLEYRTLKYNKIIIKSLHFVSFLLKVSGPWLKKKDTSINNKSLQHFKTHNELEIGTTIFFIFARTHSDANAGKWVSFCVKWFTGFDVCKVTTQHKPAKLILP